MPTYFVVQTYSVSPRRQIEPDLPREVKSANEAVRLAEKLSDTKFGVVAFSRAGNPETGDWQDAIILYQFGDFPKEDAEFIRSAA